MRPGTLHLVCLGAALLGCRPAPVAEWQGPPGSSKPSLTATGRGELLLTWFEPNHDGGYALRLTTTTAGAWNEPVTVASSDRFFVNWADFPSAVETSTGGLVVHWLEKTEAKPYAYHVRLSTSSDRGATWSAPITAHQDLSPTEHGFVAMLPKPDGGVSVGWLDGGAMVDSGGAMSARVADLLTDGTMANETVLDTRTCECCQLSMARARNGLVVSYRNRSEEEVRDIAVVRQLDGGWTEPQLVHADNWVWKACPVNGPSIAASGDAVAVAWYTGAGETAAVKAAFSADGGASFGPPTVVDEGNPLGRVHFQLLDPERGAVVWLEASGAEAAWKLRTVHADGTLGPARTVGNTGRARDAGFPRTALIGSNLYAAWTLPGEKPGESRVQVSRIPMR